MYLFNTSRLQIKYKRMQHAPLPVHLSCALLVIGSLCSFVDCGYMGRNKRNNANGYGDEPTEAELTKLSRLYGRDMSSHRTDFARVGDLGERQQPIFHPRPPPIDMSEYRQQDRTDTVHHLQNQPLTPVMVKRLLRELLERLESLEGSESDEEAEVERADPGGGRCSLHGLWISAITGVAFQLEAHHDQSESNVLRVQVVDAGSVPHTPTGTQFITSQWAGTAQVSTESPTTISIILQEKLTDPEVEPRTAVFVGQCVVCSRSPAIQGTWILFPKNQICFQESRPPQADVMYLLTR